MDLGLKDKRAVVFGSSAGIGRAIAEAFLAEGARVALSARPGERLERARRETGAALALAGDLNEPGAAAKVIRDAEQGLGGVDIVVTNGGGPPPGQFADLDTAAWEQAFRSLWLSAIEAIQAALVGMRARRWGRVLMVTSNTAREPFANLTLSNALRPGLHGLVNSLSKEVAADGVTVNALMPGIIDTERLRELGIGPSAADSIPARRLGRPEEMGAMAAFLASERAAYITGQALACDGGRMASI